MEIRLSMSCRIICQLVLMASVNSHLSKAHAWSWAESSCLTHHWFVRLQTGLLLRLHGIGWRFITGQVAKPPKIASWCFQCVICGFVLTVKYFSKTYWSTSPPGCGSKNRTLGWPKPCKAVLPSALISGSCSLDTWNVWLQSLLFPLTTYRAQKFQS